MAESKELTMGGAASLAATESLVTDQVREKPESLVTGQVQPNRNSVSGSIEIQVAIVEVGAALRGITGLLESVKVIKRTCFWRTHLNPLAVSRKQLLQRRIPLPSASPAVEVRVGAARHEMSMIEVVRLNVAGTLRLRSEDAFEK